MDDSIGRGKFLLLVNQEGDYVFLEEPSWSFLEWCGERTLRVRTPESRTPFTVRAFIEKIAPMHGREHRFQMFIKHWPVTLIVDVKALSVMAKKLSSHPPVPSPTLFPSEA